MTVQNRITIPDHEVIETLRRSAEILPSPDAPDFADVFERFGDARIVLLGEATHGTHEFYAARAAITRRLGVVKAILSLTVRAARLGG